MRGFDWMARGWRSWRDGMDGASIWAVLGLSVGAVFIGLVTVMVGGASAGRPALLAVLPVLLLTAFLFIYSRESFLLVVMLVRAGANPIFEETRLAAVGGLGGLLNALVVLIAAMIISRDPKRIPKAAWWVWLPFCVMQLIGLGYSPEPVQAVRLYLGQLSVVALFLVSFYLITNEADLNKMLRLVTWSSVPVAVVTLIYIALGKTAGIVDGLEDAGARYGGPFPHANILAFYLVLALGVIFYRWKSGQIGQGFARTTVVVAYMLLLVGLLYTTKTRSAWISVLFIFVVYGIVRERRYLVYLAIGGIAAMAALPELRERVMGLSEGNQVVQYAKLNSFAWRKLLWADALHWMSTSRYITGYGAESFMFHSPTFFSMAGGRNWGAHSAVVQVFFELGVFGALAYGWIYLSTVRMLKRLWRPYGLLGLISTVLLIGNFLVSLSDNMLSYLIYNWYFWFCMGAVCALAMRQPKAASESVRRYDAWAVTQPLTRVPTSVAAGVSTRPVWRR
ncbi:O-antigen ligase family protein [Roseateles amylovorans]|uniref:O-antigen ligase family protein n=1 Tax=Roseateles amylovorans TaxID=2978473 RepID=A0ABY6B6C2_9BURK|nr:O-antigen ligase family protein [Roseateles amylovorans]UXH79491.1 O-antigen ligase family protein [Roseateles amylovorans]